MSGRFKDLAGVATAAMLTTGLVGAHAQGAKKSDIVTVVKISGIQWFNRMEEGVKKFAADTGNKAFQVGPAKADAQLQVQLVEDMIAQGVDAIAVVPFAPEALEPVLKKAMDKGIKVVSHEASEIQNVDWDVEAFSNAAYGEHLGIAALDVDVILTQRFGGGDQFSQAQAQIRIVTRHLLGGAFGFDPRPDAGQRSRAGVDGTAGGTSAIA